MLEQKRSSMKTVKEKKERNREIGREERVDRWRERDIGTQKKQ